MFVSGEEVRRGGGVNNCMTRNRTQLGKRQRGGAPGEKDRQTE